jgi:hypothetical protein
LSATANTAALVAAGELASVSSSIAVLMKGALTTMFVAKLKMMAGVLVVMLALGASGLAYRASAQSGPAPAPKKEGKPLSEIEALRRENELLKLNLEVVLEKVRAQEAELRAMKAQAARGQAAFSPDGKTIAFFLKPHETFASPDGKTIATKDGTIRLWDAASGKEITKKELQGAKNKEELRRTVDALEKAVKELREQLKKQEGTSAPK